MTQSYQNVTVLVWYLYDWEDELTRPILPKGPKTELRDVVEEASQKYQDLWWKCNVELMLYWCCRPQWKDVQRWRKYPWKILCNLPDMCPYILIRGDSIGGKVQLIAKQQGFIHVSIHTYVCPSSRMYILPAVSSSSHQSNNPFPCSVMYQTIQYMSIVPSVFLFIQSEFQEWYGGKVFAMFPWDCCSVTSCVLATPTVLQLYGEILM